MILILEKEHEAYVEKIFAKKECRINIMLQVHRHNDSLVPMLADAEYRSIKFAILEFILIKESSFDGVPVE